MNDSLTQRRFPIIAVALAAAIVATAVMTGVFGHDLATRTAGDASFGWPALSAGRWWTLATSLLLTRDWFMAATMPLAIVLALGSYERRAGSTRAAVVAAVGHATGSIVVALLSGLLGVTGIPIFVRAAQNLDYGASMIVAAALGALASHLGRRRLTLLAMIGVVVLVPLHHQMADWAHLVALPTGFVIDRTRRPTMRVVGFASVAALTAGLTVAGTSVVAAGADAVRFHEIERPPAHIATIDYLAPALGNRPEVARAIAPAHADGPLHLVLFFHGVPGSPDDWIVGAHLNALLQHNAATGHTVAVLVDAPGYHNPRVGWRDVRHQHTIRSIERDLLPVVARRYHLELTSRSIAVVSVGRGARGAVALARRDPRVGWLVALDPSFRVPAIRGVNEHVVVTPQPHILRSVRRTAVRRWATWNAMLPPALSWLDSHGFGHATS